MAVIHRTTVTPSKLDLLTTWLPSRPWYRGSAPRLRKAGGFRIDDPAGAVGIEFLLVVDESDGVLYQVPLTYRGAPLAEAVLVGTAEHGVLGRRWIYDATSDPVAIGAVADLLTGRTVAQAQNDSDTVDSTVVVTGVGAALLAGELGVAVDDSAHTAVALGSTVVRFHRVPVVTRLDCVGSIVAPADSGSVVELVTVG
ncbi:maltokinase N-terminal cap-like domain-containing protein [Nocardia lasii]|uniref:1,4-alpha-glucan branching protein n=1 Tax=Nocardia lasii TaxID=1616107 RepID=A0ABW1JNJ2_9NOCA